MTRHPNSIDDVILKARGLLSFQGELGLSGLDVPFDLLQPRRVREHSTPPAKTAPAFAPDEIAADPQPRLEQLAQQLTVCKRCALAKQRTNVVFGAGAATARLMFVGEAPGRDEDLQGQPFVGAAGQLLDRMIVAMGLCRKDVYVANIVKCRPPRNRDPQPEEVAACEGFLRAQLAIIQPEVVVALGRYAAQTLLRDARAISQLRGRWRDYQGTPLMPTFHPAYLLRNPGEKRLVWQDLQQVMRRMGLPMPARAARQ